MSACAAISSASPRASARSASSRCASYGRSDAYERCFFCSTAVHSRKERRTDVARGLREATESEVNAATSRAEGPAWLMGTPEL